VFVNASFCKVSVAAPSPAITETESVIVATPLDIIIVEEFAVCGVNPNIPSLSNDSFHSAEPTGDVPSSG
jgi:hypothetical protein